MSIKRRNFHLVIGTSLLVLIGVLVFTAGPLVGRFVLGKLRDRLTAKRGAHLEVQSFEADFFHGSFRFQGFEYREEIKGERLLLITAEEGEIDIELGSLFADSLVIDQLQLVKPTILYQQWKKRPDNAKLPQINEEIQMKNLLLKEGDLLLEDFSEESPAKLQIHLTSFKGNDLSTHEPFSLCTRIEAHGTLGEDQFPFRIQGNDIKQTANTELSKSSCQIEGIAIPPLLPYLVYGVPIQATRGWFDGNVTIRSTENQKVVMRAELVFRDVALDLGGGPWMFLAERTGVPQAIASRGGNFSVVVTETFSLEEVHGYAGDFLRKFLGITWQQALTTLTMTN